MEKEDETGQGKSGVLPGLIFLGTPDFAVPSLTKLAEAGAPIHLIVTQPDRAKGRSKKPVAPPVKVLAQELGLPVFQPEKLRRPEVMEKLRSSEARCLVVVAYGQLIPWELLSAFPLGALNIHPSLLPRYRGPAPIQRCLLAGDRVTGVSIMLLDEGMDTGPVLCRQTVPLEPNDCFGSLHDKLAGVGADLLCKTLEDWSRGMISPEPQDESEATYAPPIDKKELRIQWDLPAAQAVNTIRAFDPWPGAHGFFQGKRLKCFKAALLPWRSEGRPGEILGSSETGLTVVAGDGRALSIGELQLEGHRRMPASVFALGRSMPAGSRLE